MKARIETEGRMGRLVAARHFKNTDRVLFCHWHQPDHFKTNFNDIPFAVVLRDSVAALNLLKMHQ